MIDVLRRYHTEKSQLFSRAFDDGGIISLSPPEMKKHLLTLNFKEA